jgi:hypothetical protein
MTTSWSFNTKQIYAAQVVDPTTRFRALPIYQTTSYIFRYLIRYQAPHPLRWRSGLEVQLQVARRIQPVISSRLKRRLNL